MSLIDSIVHNFTGLKNQKDDVKVREVIQQGILACREYVEELFENLSKRSFEDFPGEDFDINKYLSDNLIILDEILEASLEFKSLIAFHKDANNGFDPDLDGFFKYIEEDLLKPLVKVLKCKGVLVLGDGLDKDQIGKWDLEKAIGADQIPTLYEYFGSVIDEVYEDDRNQKILSKAKAAAAKILENIQLAYEARRKKKGVNGRAVWDRAFRGSTKDEAWKKIREQKAWLDGKIRKSNNDLNAQKRKYRDYIKNLFTGIEKTIKSLNPLSSAFAWILPLDAKIIFGSDVQKTRFTNTLISNFMLEKIESVAELSHREKPRYFGIIQELKAAAEAGSDINLNKILNLLSDIINNNLSNSRGINTKFLDKAAEVLIEIQDMLESLEAFYHFSRPVYQDSLWRLLLSENDREHYTKLLFLPKGGLNIDLAKIKEEKLKMEEKFKYFKLYQKEFLRKFQKALAKTSPDDYTSLLDELSQQLPEIAQKYSEYRDIFYQYNKTIPESLRTKNIEILEFFGLEKILHRFLRDLTSPILSFLNKHYFYTDKTIVAIKKLGEINPKSEEELEGLVRFIRDIYTKPAQQERQEELVNILSDLDQLEQIYPEVYKMLDLEKTLEEDWQGDRERIVKKTKERAIVTGLAIIWILFLSFAGNFTSNPDNPSGSRPKDMIRPDSDPELVTTIPNSIDEKKSEIIYTAQATNPYILPDVLYRDVLPLDLQGDELSNVKSHAYYDSPKVVDPNTPLDENNVVVSGVPGPVPAGTRSVRAPKNHKESLQVLYNGLSVVGIRGGKKPTKLAFEIGSVPPNIYPDGFLKNLLNYPKEVYSNEDITYSQAFQKLEEIQQETGSRLVGKILEFSSLLKEGGGYTEQDFVTDVNALIQAEAYDFNELTTRTDAIYQTAREIVEHLEKDEGIIYNQAAILLAYILELHGIQSGIIYQQNQASIQPQLIDGVYTAYFDDLGGHTTVVSLPKDSAGQEIVTITDPTPINGPGTEQLAQARENPEIPKEVDISQILKILGITIAGTGISIIVIKNLSKSKTQDDKKTTEEQPQEVSAQNSDQSIDSSTIATTEQKDLTREKIENLKSMVSVLYKEVKDLTIAQDLSNKDKFINDIFTAVFYSKDILKQNNLLDPTTGKLDIDKFDPYKGLEFVVQNIKITVYLDESSKIAVRQEEDIKI